MTAKLLLRASAAAFAAGLIGLLGMNGAEAESQAERLERADANGDGNIEWQEVLDMRSSAFARMDRNSDGVIDSGDRPGFGPGKKRFQEAFDDLATTADANKDKRITKSEMMDAPAPFFKKADTDENGVLTPEELEAVGDSVL